jgi:serine/threonine-protein kinase PRP4
LKTGRENALKILRNQEIMLKSGEREKVILEQLNKTDPHDKKHILKYKGSFEIGKHLVLIFEPMDINLREALKQYGRGKGLSLEAVRSYGMQLFIALNHLKKNRIIHADIKPDNILMSKDTKVVKLCDFGTAFPVEENTLVEYLVSRYYRAPEIVIGFTYDYAIDMWSMACTLYEIYTGRFLFDGRSNNEMLK